jgi:hypothetical protein
MYFNLEVFTPFLNQEYTMIRSPGHIDMKKKRNFVKWQIDKKQDLGHTLKEKPITILHNRGLYIYNNTYLISEILEMWWVFVRASSMIWRE